MRVQTLEKYTEGGMWTELSNDVFDKVPRIPNFMHTMFNGAPGLIVGMRRVRMEL